MTLSKPSEALIEGRRIVPDNVVGRMFRFAPGMVSSREVVAACHLGAMCIGSGQFEATVDPERLLTWWHPDWPMDYHTDSPCFCSPKVGGSLGLVIAHLSDHHSDVLPNGEGLYHHWSTENVADWLRGIDR